MSYTKKVAYNTFIQVIGRIIATIFSIIAVNLLTRYLGVEGYGRYTIIFAYVGFWTILTDFGILTILNRELAQNQQEKEKILDNVWTLRIILSILVILLSVVISRFLGYDIETKNGIAIMSLAFLLQTLNMTFVSVFQNSFQMYKGVITDAIGKAIILGLIILTVNLKASFYILITAYVIGNLFNIYLSYLYANALVKVHLAFDFRVWKKILSESVPIGLMGVFGYFYFKSDVLLLSFMKDSYDVGIYGPTYKIFEILITVPSFLVGAAFPVIGWLYKTDKDRCQRVIQKIFSILLSISIPLGISGIILAKPILVFLSGGGEFIAENVFYQTWAFSGITALQLLFMGLIVSYGNAIISTTVIIAGAQRRLVLPTIIYAIFNIGFNLIFIPHFSYIATSASTS
ncbi:hypothetical protein COZ61_01925, partial [Candidatus Berkelbacteria bacterium CG_4_8_14_3_um_filter_33_6]